MSPFDVTHMTHTLLIFEKSVVQSFCGSRCYCEYKKFLETVLFTYTIKSKEKGYRLLQFLLRSGYVCVYVCMCVLDLAAASFDLETSNLAQW